MTHPITTGLLLRSAQRCELCGSSEELLAYTVPPKVGSSDDEMIAACTPCLDAIETPAEHADHWRCLNDSMWSQVPAVQVLSYRLLKELDGQAWAADLLAMMYLDEPTQEWADVGAVSSVKHYDSNGVLLTAGDTVVLVKDLNVKGGGFTAKRGTAVRRISLVRDNPQHIEGRVNDQQIVILTQYVKKS